MNAGYLKHDCEVPNVNLSFLNGKSVSKLLILIKKTKTFDEEKGIIKRVYGQ